MPFFRKSGEYIVFMGIDLVRDKRITQQVSDVKLFSKLLVKPGKIQGKIIDVDFFDLAWIFSLEEWKLIFVKNRKDLGHPLVEICMTPRKILHQNITSLLLKKTKFIHFAFCGQVT
jgi:hypothetical protein